MLKKLSTPLKILVTLALIALLYRKLDYAALRQSLANVRFAWIAAFFALLALNTALSALKWKILLAADGIRQPFLTLMASYWIGSFFNMFLPSTIGGDAYRIADIGIRSSKTANAAASVMADRISGFFALAIYGLAFPLFAHRSIPAWNPCLMILPIIAFAALLAISFALWNQRLPRMVASWLPGKWAAKATAPLDTILASIRAYGQKRSTVLHITLISFAFQLTAIAAVFAVGQSLSMGIGILPYCFFVPFISLMEMIPITIFGIGLRDTGYLWFMKSVGRPDPTADAAAMVAVYLAATVAYVSCGAIIYIFRRCRRTSK